MNKKNDKPQDELSITWAINTLKAKAFNLDNTFTPVRLRHWSNVYHAQTSKGMVFLKVASPPFHVEVKLLPYLAEQFPTLPKVIACNQELQCILMQDAGSPLYPLLKKDFQLNFVKQALKKYANIQQNVSTHIDTLIDLGVPDRRLHTLPSQYLALLENTDFLIHDGLSLQEISQLKTQHFKVQQLCDALAHYNIPETIEHGDFTVNNMLINKQHEIIINDWGDAVVTHPFFSLYYFLDDALEDYETSLWSSVKNTVEETYIGQWSTYITQEDYQKLKPVLISLHKIYLALVYYRFDACLGGYESEEYKNWEYKGCVAETLKIFITDTRACITSLV
jgi:hypothetical protein